MTLVKETTSSDCRHDTEVCDIHSVVFAYGGHILKCWIYEDHLTISITIEKKCDTNLYCYVDSKMPELLLCKFLCRKCALKASCNKYRYGHMQSKGDNVFL